MKGFNSKVTGGPLPTHAVTRSCLAWLFWDVLLQAEVEFPPNGRPVAVRAWDVFFLSRCWFSWVCLHQAQFARTRSPEWWSWFDPTRDKCPRLKRRCEAVCFGGMHGGCADYLSIQSAHCPDEMAASDVAEYCRNGLSRFFLG